MVNRMRRFGLVWPSVPPVAVKFTVPPALKVTAVRLNVENVRLVFWPIVFTLIVDAPAAMVAWPIVSKKYAEAHRDLVERMVKSLVQGLAFEVQHPAESQQILGKYAKTDDTTFLKNNYELAAPYLRKVPTPSIEGVRSALEEFASTNPAAKTADPASFVDDRYIKALDASGFIASLYK